MSGKVDSKKQEAAESHGGCRFLHDLPPMEKAEAKDKLSTAFTCSDSGEDMYCPVNRVQESLALS
ncbi:MAG: hypothetical protein WB502_11310 [Thermoactinomyces sp.]